MYKPLSYGGNKCQLPAFIKRLGHHITQPHHTTFLNIVWCGCGVGLVCMAYGRRLVLLGHHIINYQANLCQSGIPNNSLCSVFFLSHIQPIILISLVSSSLTSVDVTGSTIPLAGHIKILGVTLDKHLTFDDHVTAVCKSAYYHIRAVHHIRPTITEDMAKTIACALVGSRVDYANSVLLGVSSKNVSRLQRAQNAAARVVVWGSRRRSTNSVGLLKQIHWLPVEWHIKFKIACITYKTISTTQPAYLYSSLKHYTLSRTLCSSDSKLLFVPRVRTCFGSRSFAVAAPTIWNSLPLAIRICVSTYSFRCQLKTFFYNLAFRPS